MAELSVEMTRGSLADETAYTDLLTRANGNVFMDPAGMNAASEEQHADVITLAAWEGQEGDQPRGRVLRGVWTLALERPLPIAGKALILPPYDYAFLSNPVIDREHSQAVAKGFAEALSALHQMPRTLRIRYLDGVEAGSVAVLKALKERGARICELARRDRAFAWRDNGVKKSGSTRKKMRQDRNRLAALGSLEYSNERDADAVARNFETFLAMEAASWKGKNGTAILSSEQDARFARQFISTLTAKDRASVAMLTLDGKPIAAQVLLYNDETAYTWKISYDEEYARYSPGILLVASVTEELFNIDGIEAIESCSPDGSFMETMWTGRRPTLDVLVHLGRGPSWTFGAIRLWACLRSRLKEGRDKLKAAARKRATRKA